MSSSSSSGDSYFLFLEIRDPDFNAFYDDLVWTISGVRPRKPPHLTVRGPYARPIPRREVERFRSVMTHSVLEIGGLHRFSNPDQEVVYLSVNSTQLRSIWWKPSYPIKDFGFNPHISIYRGDDRALADRLMSFEPLHRLRFLCAEFGIVPVVHAKRSSDELGLRQFKRARDHRRFEESRALPLDFFERLALLVSGSAANEQLTLDLG